MNQNKPDQIEIPAWAGQGTGRLIRREYLPADHPHSNYNYIKNVLNLKPEDYGVFDRKTEIIRERLEGKTESELKTMVAELQIQMEAMERAGF